MCGSFIHRNPAERAIAIVRVERRLGNISFKFKNSGNERECIVVETISVSFFSLTIHKHISIKFIPQKSKRFNFSGDGDE